MKRHRAGLVLLALLGVPGLAAGQSNEITKDQIGNKNTAVVEQRHVTGSTVSFLQKGDEHEATITQAGSNGPHARIVQRDGSGSEAVIEQAGHGHRAEVEQAGDAHLVSLQQSGELHQAVVMQAGGAGSRAEVTQQGGGGSLTTVTQDGDRHTAQITQTGDLHQADVAQQGGEENTAAVTQQGGDDNEAEVGQDGDRNRATLVQEGDDVVSRLRQDGDRNTAAARLGAGTSTQRQEGDDNLAEIGTPAGRPYGTRAIVQQQMGDDNAAFIGTPGTFYGEDVRQLQEGDDNRVHLEGLEQGSESTQQQEGDFNTAEFHSTGSVEALTLRMQQEGDFNEAYVDGWTGAGTVATQVRTDQYGDYNVIEVHGNGYAYNDVDIAQGDRPGALPGQGNHVAADLRSEGNTLAIEQTGAYNYTTLALRPGSGAAGVGLGSTIEVTQEATGTDRRSGAPYGGFNNVFDLRLNVITTLQLHQTGNLNTATWDLSSGGASVNQVGTENVSIITN